MQTQLRITELWDAIAQQLNDDLLIAILGGAGRVYVPSMNPVDDIAREGRPGEPWGRIIFLPRTTLWPQIDEPGDTRKLAWLVSVQFNDFRASGYDVSVSVDAAHERVYRLLDGFAPSMERVTVFVPLWRNGQPSAAPVYDPQRRLWLSNAEWRTEVAAREQIES